MLKIGDHVATIMNANSRRAPAYIIKAEILDKLIDSSGTITYIVRGVFGGNKIKRFEKDLIKACKR
jgi:hypothetical protein